jgi:glycosyltransferase involved in cell wall biosynthesis
VTTENPIELSVILPAYNEGPAVAEAIGRYLRALEACCRGFEIIVIDDGSRDDTLAAAEKAAEGHVEVRVLRNPKNLGQVGTILRGFSEARGQVMMHNGMDLPFGPEDTSAVLERLRDGADVVVVERADRQAYGLFRKIISWCNIALVRVLLHSSFIDHNFVQAYRRRVLDAINVESRGVSTVTVELILKSQVAGFRVDRIEAKYHRRTSGDSTITLRKIVRTTVELFTLWRIMRRQRRAACRATRQHQALSGVPNDR